MTAAAHSPDRISLHRVSEALGDRVARRRGDQLDARCPAHEDTAPSLSVTWRRDRRGAGRTFVHCHGGCATPAVLDALGLALTDLYDAPPARPSDPARQRWTAPAPRPRRPRPEQPPAAAGSAGSAEPTRRLVATYPYCDADGVVTYEVSRWDPKGFTVRTVDSRGRRTPRWPAEARRVLYRLPEVAAAIAAGAPVFVCEGEKDADALAGAGVVGTCNAGGAAAGGATSRWLATYTAALAGGHVVVVADRDPAGWEHAAHLVEQLAPVAASLRVVSARTGKDAADHLSAGCSVEEFEPAPAEPVELRRLAGLDVDAAAAPEPTPAPGPAPEPAPAPAPGAAGGAEPVDLERARRRRRPGTEQGDGEEGGDRRGGGGGGSTPTRGQVIVRPRFEARGDGLYTKRYDVARDVEVLTQVLSVRVRQAARVALDVGDGTAPELNSVDLVAEHDGETVELTGVSRRRWESCSWVGELPWPVVYEDTAKGRAVLRNAVVATSGPVSLSTAYGTLGWQLIAGEWSYVHAGGAINTAGPVPGVRVQPPAPLAPLALPAAPVNVEELAAAVRASTVLLDVVPPRIAAPLLGAAYRALLGFCRVTVMPVGAKGTGKSGLSAFACQHYGPTVRQKNMINVGAGDRAASINALEELRFQAGEVLLGIDDLAPDKGTKDASERLAALARSQYNRTGKNRLTRDLTLRVPHPPRSLPLVTGEEGTTVDSADSRIVSLRVHHGDVNLDVKNPDSLPAQDRGDGPRLRAALTAAMVQHHAARMPMTDWLDQAEQRYRAALADPAAAGDGVDGRQSESLAELAVGWQAMLTMATERGALSVAERDALWARAWAGLVEAKEQLRSGAARRTPAERFRELLRTVLVRGGAQISNTQDGVPEHPALHGWKPSDMTASGFRAPDDKIGWTDQRTVWLMPGATYAAVARQAAAQDEALSLTHAGLSGALADAGVLRTRLVKGAVRFDRCKRLGAAHKTESVWEIDWAWLFPDEDEHGDDDPGADDDRGPDPDSTPPPPPLDPLPPAGTAGPFRPAERPADAPDAPPPADVRDGHDEVRTEPLRAPLGAAAPAPGAALSSGADQAGTGPLSAPTDAPDSAPDSAPDPAPDVDDGPGAVAVDDGTVEAGAGAAGVPGGPAGEQAGRPGPARARAGVQYRGVALVAAGSVGWVARVDGEPAPVELDPAGGLAAVLDVARAQELGHRPPFGRGTARHAPGQVWLGEAARRAAGLPAELEPWEAAREPASHRRAREAIEAAGWKVIGNRVGAWTSLYHEADGGRRWQLVVPEWLASPTPFEEGTASAQALARRLGRYAALVGMPYAYSAGVSGVTLIGATRPELWEAGRPELPAPAGSPTREGDYSWARPVQPDEAAAPFVDLWDFNGLYLGASRSLPLGLGAAEHVESPEFDPTMPGYWLIEAPEWEHARLPDPFCVSGRSRSASRLWVTTPTLKIATELYDMPVRIVEAHVWRRGNSVRVLDKWAGRLSGARSALLGPAAAGDRDAAAVLDAVKGAYRAGIGRLDATRWRGTTYALHRPDWRHAVVAQGRYAITRRLVQAADRSGRWPLAISVDAVAYPSWDPEPLPPAGFTAGPGLGEVKHLSRVPTSAVAGALAVCRGRADRAVLDALSGRQGELS